MGHKFTRRDAVIGLFDAEIKKIRLRRAGIGEEIAALKAELLSLDREEGRLEGLSSNVAEALTIERSTSPAGGE